MSWCLKSKDSQKPNAVTLNADKHIRKGKSHFKSEKLEIEDSVGVVRSERVLRNPICCEKIPGKGENYRFCHGEEKDRFARDWLVIVRSGAQQGSSETHKDRIFLKCPRFFGRYLCSMKTNWKPIAISQIEYICWIWLDSVFNWEIIWCQICWTIKKPTDWEKRGVNTTCLTLLSCVFWEKKVDFTLTFFLVSVCTICRQWTCFLNLFARKHSTLAKGKT